MKWIIRVVLLFLLTWSCLAADKPAGKGERPKPAQSIDELRQQIEKILTDTHTNGVSIAIVQKNGPEWVTGLGMADLAGNRAATANTLFRIGSTSKAFVSLSILMLVEQGKLSLDDPLHTLAPEVWFDNPWESSDPVRVVNLLEHTTGWDDLHFREYAKQAPDSMSLREGLDYDHHSRKSRWPPGTRMAYCNSGPAVAAYVVEKLTGQKFEDFVQQNLFNPIGIKTATYFEPAPGTATTLYRDDGKTPYPYSHIIMRPAGAINASANDMAAYLQFYLNRGAVGGKQVVLTADIDRMEVPKSTWAAKDGMKFGYGLSNFWTVDDGFVYHGHDGAIDGGLTDVAYMPEYGVGYFFSINSDSDDAFEKITHAMRAYITHSLQKPPVPPPAQLSAYAADYSGWYEPDSRRTELTYFLARLHGLSRVKFQDGQLILSSAVGGQKGTFSAGDSKPVQTRTRERSPASRAHPRIAQCEHRGSLYPGRAGNHENDSHLVCDRRDSMRSLRYPLHRRDCGLCAVLALRGLDQEPPPSRGARHAILAAARGSQSDGICRHLHHGKQRSDRPIGISDRLVGVFVGGDSGFRTRGAGEFLRCLAPSRRRGAERRSSVLADRIACPGDRSGVFGLLGNYWGADLGLTIRAR